MEVLARSRKRKTRTKDDADSSANPASSSTRRKRRKPTDPPPESEDPLPSSSTRKRHRKPTNPSPEPEDPPPSITLAELVEAATSSKFRKIISRGQAGVAPQNWAEDWREMVASFVGDYLQSQKFVIAEVGPLGPER